MARRPGVHDAIQSRKAPKPIGPYVQAVRVQRPGQMLFVSGQIPIEVPSGNVFTGDIKKQAEIAFNHVKNIVLDAKFSMDEVVKVTIFLKDLNNFDAVKPWELLTDYKWIMRQAEGGPHWVAIGNV